jgi:hypothetical protein
MEKINQIDYLNVVSKAFIEATNEILDLYQEQPARTTLTDEFSIVLLKIYQNFMLDLMPSSQMLVDKHNFYSFSILCRSSLDIIIQIKWILSLNGVEQDNAIKIFLNFEGVGTGKNGKDFYEWQKEINPKYSTRQIAIDLGIDQENIILPLTEHSQYQELKLTVFDYLSKITHWNPRFINDLVGYNSDMHLGDTIQYLRMATISSEAFVYCAMTFAEIFIERCLGVESETIKQKTNSIREKFRQSFVQFYSKHKMNEEEVV